MANNILNKIKYHFKYRKNRIKDPIGTRITFGIVAVIFLLFSLVYIYIYFWLFMTCFKSPTEIALHPWDLPEKLRWSNFVEMFKVFTYADTSLAGMIWNSVWHSVGGTLLNVWGTLTIAYLCSKYKFPGYRFIPAPLY